MSSVLRAVVDAGVVAAVDSRDLFLPLASAPRKVAPATPTYHVANLDLVSIVVRFEQ